MADDFIYYQIFSILTQKHGLGNQSHDLTFGSLNAFTLLDIHSTINKVVSALKISFRGKANGPLYFFFFLNVGVLYLPLQDETPMSWCTSKEG